MTLSAPASDLSDLPLLEPDLDRARELAGAANVIPVRHTFIEDCETPVSAFLKLRGAGPSFLLESAEQGGRLGRWSFLGFRPRTVLRWSDGRLHEWSGGAGAALEAGDPVGAGGVVGARGPAGAGGSLGLGDPDQVTEAPDPYAAVANYLERFEIAESDALPPFAGGAVGFFGYDLVRTVEPLAEPNPDPVGLPDMALMISDLLLAFDHQRHELTIIANAFVDDTGGIDAAYDRAAERIAEVRERLRGPVPPPELSGAGDQAGAGGEGDRRGGGHVGADGTGRVEFTSNMTQAEFESKVERIIAYIHAGDAFQVVPSQRFSADAPAEAFSIYRGLRTVNPSPYMYFLDFGDFQIVGASPEPLVKVTGSRVETRPIAGTYPRGGDEEEDRRRAERLLADPKERAEHLMLVDLGRNDLGRVCEYGSVTVEELMVVETYSHVMHIVSAVAGKLRRGVGAMDVLRAALPAGTLSGAPKVRAMQIIDELEPHKRGSYGGAIGYLSYTGDLDTAIHIRTVVVKDGKVHIQAGGGTVADAKPTYEYNESVTKAKAVFRAVELAASQPEWP